MECRCCPAVPGVLDAWQWMRSDSQLMEDAATAEISRAQIWQWIRYNARLTNGKRADRYMLSFAIWNFLNQAKQRLGADRFAESKFERGGRTAYIVVHGRISGVPDNRSLCGVFVTISVQMPQGGSQNGRSLSLATCDSSGSFSTEQ